MRLTISTLLCALIGVAVAFGQQPAPSFELVSITRNYSPSPYNSGQSTTDSVTTFTNLSVQAMVIRGFVESLPRDFEGLPEWAHDRYDVVVKLPAGSRMNPAMWRSLVAARLNLQAHIEHREKDGFALVRVGGELGPRLKPSTLDCATNATATPSPVSPNTPRPSAPRWPTREEAVGKCGYLAGGGAGFVVSGGMRMEWLSGIVGGLIAEDFMSDRTGLSGYYAVELDFPPTRIGASRYPVRSEVLVALREQLGLTVQPDRVPIPVLVIDHIERPSEN